MRSFVHAPPGAALATFFAFARAAGLNDIGITFCGAASCGNNSSCLSTDRGGLDAVSGLRKLWSYKSAARAAKFWKHWYFWATHSRLAPMIDAARLIARDLPNVRTYFVHGITNAVAERLNSKKEDWGCNNCS